MAAEVFLSKKVEFPAGCAIIFISITIQEEPTMREMTAAQVQAARENISYHIYRQVSTVSKRID